MAMRSKKKQKTKQKTIEYFNLKRRKKYEYPQSQK